MIKILSELKKSDPKLFVQVEQSLEKFGGQSSKGYFNRLSYPDYLDLISFADTYSFQPTEYGMVMDVLSDLNPAENIMMQKVKNCRPQDYKKLLKLNMSQNNRTRQRVLAVVATLTKDKPSFVQALKKVFS